MAPSAQLQQVLQKVAEDARKVLALSQVRAKVCCTEALLKEKLEIIKGAVIEKNGGAPTRLWFFVKLNFNFFSIYLVKSHQMEQFLTCFQVYLKKWI